jgi:hypothetical protein
MVVGRGVSYFGNRYPAHARADLEAMVEAGASYVVHVMTEDDLRWGPESVARLVAQSHDLGLDAWLDPWGVGGVFGGEAASYAVMEFPTACQRTSLGTHKPALCPRSTAFRDLIERWLDAAAATGATTVLWDEPHLFILRHQRTAAKWSCRCLGCRRAFAERFGQPMPRVWTPEVRRVAEDLIAETVAWLVALATARGLASAVVLLPDEDGYEPDRWRAVAALPGVRAFGTDPYWFGFPNDPAANGAYVRRWSERTIAATRGLPVRPMGWLQAFRVPAGREAEIAWAAELMVEAGIESVAAWAYRGCAAMSRLAADDPEAVWGVVARCFTALAGRGLPVDDALRAAG